jgi:hypothetical protein
MKKLLYSLALVLFVTPTVINATELFYIPMPYIFAKWKVGCQKMQSNGSTTIRYVLEHETMENWTQLVNVQFKERGVAHCSDALQAMQQEAALNKGVAFKVHAKSENDVLFEKSFPSGMHELVRMVMTEKGLHRIAYTRRDAPFEEIDRNQWLERLAKGLPLVD